jgi:hypothetical protein
MDETLIYKLIPYNRNKLDCFQLLLVSILQAKHYQVDRLGAIWPWSFTWIEHQTTRPMANEMVVTEQKLHHYFGCRLCRESFTERNLQKSISDALKNNVIIINVDQFYIPHHYDHVYNKVHGPHNILLLEEWDNGYHCLDTMPPYKGIIDCEHLVNSIKHYSTEKLKYEYCYLEFGDDSCLTDKAILSEFIIDLEQTDLELYEYAKRFYLSGLLKMIDEKMQIMSYDSFMYWIDVFCKSEWIWGIDRRAFWLINYLKTAYPLQIIGAKLEQLINLIENINGQMNIATRLLYKGALARNKNYIERAMSMYRQLIEPQLILRKKLLDMGRKTQRGCND